MENIVRAALPETAGDDASMLGKLMSIAADGMRASGISDREIESALSEMGRRCGRGGLPSAAVYDGPGEVFPIVDGESIDSENRISSVGFSRESCFIGFPNYRTATFGTWEDTGYDGDLKSTLMLYADGFATVGKRDGYGLLIYGGHGRGKTYAACCVANAVIDRGYRALVMSTSDIMSDSPLRDVVMGEFGSADLVVIDDFGAERTSAYGRERVYALVNGLYSRGKPFIVTTNLDREQILRPPAQLLRELERIKERCHRIEYVGPNRRRPPDPFGLLERDSTDARSGKARP